MTETAPSDWQFTQTARVGALTSSTPELNCQSPRTRRTGCALEGWAETAAGE